MVTGPTGETRLVLPSRELETVGRLAFNPWSSVYVTCALYTLNVYFYLGTYVGSALCARIQIVHICGQPVRGARDPATSTLTWCMSPGLPRFQSVHPRAINYAPVRSASGEGLGSEASYIVSVNSAYTESWRCIFEVYVKFTSYSFRDSAWARGCRIIKYCNLYTGTDRQRRIEINIIY